MVVVVILLLLAARQLRNRARAARAHRHRRKSEVLRERAKAQRVSRGFDGLAAVAGSTARFGGRRHDCHQPLFGAQNQEAHVVSEPFARELLQIALEHSQRIPRSKS
jgi:hypothetical protein